MTSIHTTWFVFKTWCAALKRVWLDLAMSSMLKFRVECSETKPGPAVFLVVSAPELGNWQIGQIPNLPVAELWRWQGTWVFGFALLYEQIISDHNIIHVIMDRMESKELGCFPSLRIFRGGIQCTTSAEHFPTWTSEVFIETGGAIASQHLDWKMLRANRSNQ